MARGLKCPIERPDTFSQTVVLPDSGLLVRGGPYIFLHHRLQHLVVERQISDDRLEASILVLERTQLTGVANLHAAVLRPPPIEGVFADPVLPAQVGDLLPRLRGLQDRDDLLLRESALPHQVLPTTIGGFGGLAPFQVPPTTGPGRSVPCREPAT